MRPAHLHVLIYKPGYKTHISQVYANDDKNLETDAQFGVTKTLVGNFVRHDHDPAPDPDVKGPWYSLDYTFRVEAGEAKLPRPPISGRRAANARKSKFSYGRSICFRELTRVPDAVQRAHPLAPSLPLAGAVHC